MLISLERFKDDAFSLDDDRRRKPGGSVAVDLPAHGQEFVH